jgi:hypothetical protein
LAISADDKFLAGLRTQMDRDLRDTETIAECHFLDVGQGTSNVILLGERRGIVIDCGPSGRIPLLLLRRYVDQIVALIVSHNDKDHQGGASAIIAAYPNAIDRVFFLQDRPVEEIALYGLVGHALSEGTLISPPIRLERDDQPRIVFSDAQKSLSLELIFPNFKDNLDAQKLKHPNDTSAVLVLFCGSRKIVYPGDSSISDWRRIRERLGSPITADIVSVPHHGGNIGYARLKSETATDFDSRQKVDLQWLYSEGMRCSFAVVSVGTSNQYGHPKVATISALISANSQVICTQITSSCHDDVEQLRPGVRRADFPSQSRAECVLTKSGNSRNVACAGTVIAEIGPNTVTIQRFHDHQAGVNNLQGSLDGHPLCRSNSGDPTD